MRGASAAVALAAALAVGGAAQTELVRVPHVFLSPAYDVVTQSSLRNLTTALRSYAMFEGTLETVTVADLAEWGWTPSDTTSVTIWVSGDQFRAVAQDVRPGSLAFAVSTTGERTSTGERTPLTAEPVEPVVTIQVVSSL